MDSLITAAARALAAGDLLGALKRIALRDDAPGAGACALAILKTRRLHWRLAGISRHRPDPQHRPDSRLERAYHRADKAIENMVDLLAAA